MKKKIILTTFVLLWVSQMMAVDYTINVQSEGCNAVAYTLPSGAVGQIQAVANTGYHFTQWSDGNTENPRTITVTQDAAYTAIFAADVYALSVQSADADMGTVSGGGTYVYNTNATLTATPNAGYKFVQWQDGNTDNPRTITVTGDKTYTATFAAITYTITAKSNNTSYGTVSGSGEYNVNTTATLTATPKSGYKFVQWNDGSTQNPRTITVTGDKTYTATFEGVPYTITAKSANNLMGTVSGSGTYVYNTNATLTATPNAGYEFVQWNDGSTQNPRTVTVTGDKTYTAQFAPKYTIGVKANGCDLYEHQVEEGKQLVIMAEAGAGYHFVQWNDGNTQNPRTITVTQDAAYTAIFAVDVYALFVRSADADMGTVSGGGIYVYNTNAGFTATPNEGYEFVRWNDGNNDNPRIVKIMQDTVFIATFRAKPIVTVAPNYAEMGSVSGGGTYATGSTASLTATPNAGYEFVRWSDGNTDNPRMVRVTQDFTFTAIFRGVDCEITIITNDDTWGSVEGEGTYEYGTIAVLKATPAVGCKFVKWNDGSTENPHYVKVEGNKMYLATFAEGTPTEETHGATQVNDGIAVTPFETKAEFTWPSITGVASYSLVIWADEAQGKKVCTFTFNANGQLTNIDFTQSVQPQGSASLEGLNFTVTGLKPGTTYGYTLDAKDAEDDVIETKHGTFTTMGADGITDITAAGITAAGINIYTEGRTIIVENATEAITVSDALGRVVGKDDAHIVPTETHKFPVPSSGVYVVKIGNRVASVLVR